MREGYAPTPTEKKSYRWDQNKPMEEITDPEELFDRINTDVRRRKKAGENIAFKSHPHFKKWEALREANVAKYLQADSAETEPGSRKFQDQATLEEVDDRARKAEVLAAKKAEEEDLDSLSIDSFYKDGKKINSAHASKTDADKLLLGKNSGLSVAGRLVEGGFEGKEAERQIRSIIRDMGQLKNVYSIQINSLEGMGFLDKITGRRSALEKQMAETQAEILVKSEALLKEFKVSGQVFEDQEAIVERLWDLSKKLESKISPGEAAVALAVLTAVVMGCAGDVAKKVSAADGFRAPVVASYDDFGDSDLDRGSSASDLVEEKVSGYKVSSETVSSSADSEGKVTKEIFSLTPEESKKVNSFTSWRRAILNPEFIGKMKKDGSIPTTERGYDVAPGTKVEILVNGEAVVADEVEKGGSIWGVLGDDKNEITKVSEKVGWDKLDLRIVEPINDAKDVINKIKGGTSHDKKKGFDNKPDKEKAKVGASEAREDKVDPELEEALRDSTNKKLEKIGVGHQVGHDYTSPADYQDAIDELSGIKTDDADLKYQIKKEIKRLGENREGLDKKFAKAKAEAGKYLENKGAKHTVGVDYKTVEGYDQAIAELAEIEEAILSPVIVDMEQTDDSKNMFEVKTGVRVERERLEQARKDLRISQIQSDIDKESKMPPEGAPVKMEFNVAPSISELATETELAIRAGGRFAGPLIDARKLVVDIDAFSERPENEGKIGNFLDDAKKAGNIYKSILIPDAVDDKFASKPFVIKQAEIGLKIAQDQIDRLQKFVPEKAVSEVIDSALSKFNSLKEKNRDRTGNVALFGADGALETLQAVIDRSMSAGKISNADKKKIKQIQKIAHTVLQSKNNLPNDRNVAKEILSIIDTMNRAVSPKDQEKVYPEKDQTAFSGVRYESPTPNEEGEGRLKDLEKILSHGVQNKIDSLYQLSGELFDADRSDPVAQDLVSAASLLEQLIVRSLEVSDIEDKLERTQSLIEKLKQDMGKNKNNTKKYGEVLSQLENTFNDVQTSLVSKGVLVKKATPPTGGQQVTKASK